MHLLARNDRFHFPFIYFTELVKSLPFNITEARKRYPFRAEPPRLGHYKEYFLGYKLRNIACRLVVICHKEVKTILMGIDSVVRNVSHFQPLFCYFHYLHVQHYPILQA